jgi:hypothetical protein
MLGSSRVAAQLAASQEGLSSMRERERDEILDMVCSSSEKKDNF